MPHGYVAIMDIFLFLFPLPVIVTTAKPFFFLGRDKSLINKVAASSARAPVLYKKVRGHNLSTLGLYFLSGASSSAFISSFSRYVIKVLLVFLTGMFLIFRLHSICSGLLADTYFAREQKAASLIFLVLIEHDLSFFKTFQEVGNPGICNISKGVSCPLLFFTLGNKRHQQSDRIPVRFKRIGRQVTYICQIFTKRNLRIQYPA